MTAALTEIPLRCECGTVTGSLQVRGLAVHGACYCRDCQAFARFLGQPERMLNEQAGTDVIGTLPHRLRIATGHDRLACVTLTPRGPLRWYAECCRMAIANGSRTPQTPFATVHRRALAVSQAELDRAFGPSSFNFATTAAAAAVASKRIGFVFALPKILWNLLSAKLSGSWRENPFFKPGTDEPIRAPQALSKAQRYALRGDQQPS